MPVLDSIVSMQFIETMLVFYKIVQIFEDILVDILWVRGELILMGHLQYNQDDFKNKINKMNNPYNHRRKSQQPSRRTSDLTRHDAQQNRTISTAQITNANLNNQFLMSRRENYLNTGYNIRKQKLQDITAQNRKIYIKINSQKSVYSRDQLRKSYESNASISRRLSESKISRRQSSRSSVRSSQVMRKNLAKPQAKRNYKIEANSVASIKDNQLSKIRTIFKPDPQIENKNPKTIEKRRKYSTSSNQTIIKEELKVKLPPIFQQPKLRKPSHSRSNVSYLKNKQGAFLHIIAEEMFGKR